MHVRERGIYNDLLRTFSKKEHDLFVVSPLERRHKQKTNLYKYQRIIHLRVWSTNIQKTNWAEKGFTTVVLEYLLLFAIVKYMKQVKFDLIIYSTPPITLNNMVKYFKKRDTAATYLLLKDLFPQNAIDLKLIRKESMLHRFFKKTEKSLYLISDYIGCMSPKNVDYLLENNHEIAPSKVEVNPNSIIPIGADFSNENIALIRHEYSIPRDAILFLYGGNLGLPQGIDFMIKILSTIVKIPNVYFVLIGSGTEYAKLESWFKLIEPHNAKLIPSLPKADFDKLLKAADIGLVSLHSNFTIPNFPSRILSYMEMAIPVLLVTDLSTDIGSISESNGFGLWSEAGDLKSFTGNVKKLISSKDLRIRMGLKARKYLLENYTTMNSYNIIMKHFSERKYLE